MIPCVSEPSMHPRIERWGEAKRTFLQLEGDKLGVGLRLGELATFIGDPKGKAGALYIATALGDVGVFGTEYVHYDWGYTKPDEIAILRLTLQTAEPISDGKYVERSKHV